jgi:DNA repair exonuclease SbcCD ATPase subunit
MRINRLELENWKGIPQLELDFSPGINLLYGRNEIGKSSIIESIRQAILGDAAAKKNEHKYLVPWGRAVKAQVRMFFTSNGEEYRIEKSFPVGNTALYQRGIKVAEDAKTTREKLFNLLDISEKTTNLLQLLYINQGESLNIFDQKGKGNPLDDNTKSYIKEVIKEIAFRELQAFQNDIDGRINEYLPLGRKNLKKGSKYYELREKEIELADDLNALKEKEELLYKKIADIEKIDRDILQLQTEAANNDKYMAELKKKKVQLDDLEKKRLAIIPIQNEYEAYLKAAKDLEEIHHRLPALLFTRKARIDDLKKKTADMEKDKEQAEANLKNLKLKKQELEKIELLTHEFAKIEGDYKEIKEMESQAQEIQKHIPQILSNNLYLQDNELQKISGKLQLRSQTEAELSASKSQLHELPEITQKEIKELQKLTEEIGRLNDKITSFCEELKLNFRLTPVSEKKIPYSIEINDSHTNTGVTVEPLEISGFQKLRFKYPEHFDIDVAGNLAKTDFDALQKDFLSKQEQLKNKLAIFNVKTVEELEKIYEKRIGIKSKCDNIMTKLDSLEKQVELEKQKKEITEAIELLKQDIQKYLGDNPLPDTVCPGEENTQHSLRSSLEQLSTAKAGLGSFQSRKESILAKWQRSFLDLEKEYKKQENELQNQWQNYRDLEPSSIETVTDNDLEKTVSLINEISNKITASREEVRLLEEIELLPAVQGGHGEHHQLSLLTSQQLRDDIKQTLSRQNELIQRQQELLRERPEDEFKMNYMRRKDELENLWKEIKKIPPVEIEELESIEKEITGTEKNIKRVNDNKIEKEKERERWIGETADFSHIIEEKTDKALEYEKILIDMKGHISEIASLKLLDKLIEEEKARSQQEVFKPLQEMIMGNFSALVGDRYKIGIDNDLNLDIAGKTFTGDYQNRVEQTLSFGTKEQLSFLFRLSIAVELSRKEPWVMILDDSFVNTDQFRFSRLMDILHEQASTLQFLVFTCRPSDYFPAFNNKNLNCIDLEKKLYAGMVDSG